MGDIYAIAADKHEYGSEDGGKTFALYSTNATIQAITSGDLVFFGNLHGVALTDYNTATGAVTIALLGSFKVPVTAIKSAAGTAVVAGDPIYYSYANTRLELTAAGGIFFGNALEGLTSGATDYIAVDIVKPNA